MTVMVAPPAVGDEFFSCLPPDEGLGSSGRNYGSGSVGSGSAGSGSVYLSDSQDWVVSPSCSPDEGPGNSAISPMLAEETFRYMSKYIRFVIFLQSSFLLQTSF